MTNKELWLLSIIITFVLLLMVSLLCLLSWNYPYFADVMERTYGGVVSKEEFVERLVCYAMLLPFFVRGILDLFSDATKMV
jgi:hypothetical protein